ncbi:MAG: GlxA family transcriptional regulator [Actinobacteria bacterium]|nr:GlxA family transcriptional regulator [Actinomycetota bacterium]
MDRPTAAPRHIVIVAFPGLQSLDAVGPFEVFSTASQVAEHAGRRGYRLSLVSSIGGAVVAESGLELATHSLPHPAEPIDTLVVAGGGGVYDARHDPVLMTWLSAVAPRCRRVTTVCTGAFVAAEAGWLDGCRATTHWARAARLAKEYPAVTVDPDPIYVRDGNVWTSAGVTAGIDLSLALVQDDLGTDIAQTTARWLVMFLHRPGGQTQFAAPVWVPRAERSTVRAVQALVEAAPGGDHRVPALAAAAAMSVRHFSRVFTAEVGESPGRYVERVRVEAARHELETTDDTLDVVARRCGFGTAETLRRSFQRRLGVAPDSYRRRFHTVA